MNIFTFFCAPSSTSTAHRCVHCTEHHVAPQRQRSQQLWPNYGYQAETERFAAPVVLGFQYVQQPLHQPSHHTQQTHQPSQHPFPPQLTPATMPPTPSTTNLYTLLDLPPTAAPSTIKTSYHRLALLTHPDKNPDDPKAAERFKALSAAYAILSNPKTRAIYDKHGEVATGRAEAFDDAGDLIVGAQEARGEKGEGAGSSGDERNVSSPPSGQFEGSEVEQSTYEDALLGALRAAHARGMEEERRARVGRLYDRFWRGVRGGNSGGGVWGWTARAGEPMGEPMIWRRVSIMGNSVYSGNGGWAAGSVDQGLRERFQRGRGGVEWSPYGGWERVGEGHGRFRGWSEGGGGFVRFVGDGYGGGYDRY